MTREFLKTTKDVNSVFMENIFAVSSGLENECQGLKLSHAVSVRKMQKKKDVQSF